MLEVSEGIWRVTLPLPWELQHVHSYLLEGEHGWIVVDAGLGSPACQAAWEAKLAGLDRPIERVFVTHFHPDHVGGAAHLAALADAPVSQGEVDHRIAMAVWDDPAWIGSARAWYWSHGVPDELCDEMIDEGKLLRRYVRAPKSPDLLREGDRMVASGEEWELVVFPGHADGHVAFLGATTRRMIAGDVLLTPITPNIGLHPEGRPDPLGDYLETLERIAQIDPTLVLPGHRELIGAPAARARQIAAHHARRLDATLATLGDSPRTAYEVSIGLFGDGLSTHGRRFAVAESLSHLERLRHEGSLERLEEEQGPRVAWRRPRATP